MSGPLFVLVWGAINFVLWVVYWAVFEPDREGVAVYASAIVTVLAVAAVAAWRARRVGAPADQAPLATPDVSHSAALLGIAIGMGALSAELGPWLAYGAALTAVFAIGGLARELRAQRAAQDAARAHHRPRSEGVAK